jgi:hypothetical protein
MKRERERKEDDVDFRWIGRTERKGGHKRKEESE